MIISLFFYEFGKGILELTFKQENKGIFTVTHTALADSDGFQQSRYRLWLPKLEADFLSI